MDEQILLIEDEEALRMTLIDRLVAEGYVVDYAADGEEGLRKAMERAPDLVVLDIMLPRKNGFDVCREIRQAGLTTPILMLTARGQTVDKVVGLKLGADDYLTKPFDMTELMARIEALLRRSPGKPAAPGQTCQIGRLRIDFRGTTVTRDDELVNLSAREFQLLRYFVEHRGATLSRDELLTKVWGYNAGAFTRTVEVHVANLRQKLEDDPKQPRLIVTVSGLGYKFGA
jgi:two-component system, OmpR family, alkaline phosphatase synthesis response regulator PhoP